MQLHERVDSLLRIGEKKVKEKTKKMNYMHQKMLNLMQY